MKISILNESAHPNTALIKKKKLKSDWQILFRKIMI